MSRPIAGLPSSEARLRLARDGPNALPSARRDGLLRLLLRVLREPMFLLLIGTGGVYLALGDLHQALVLGASIVFIVAITVLQERRTERALERLRDLSSPRALVVRDGKTQRIPGAEVVLGDLVVLGEGDRVPADARLMEAHALRVDESLLTGESMPVAKDAAGQADRSDRVFSGTLVVGGSARAEVTATGERTELGRIGASLAALEGGRTALERETGRIVRYIAVAAVALCVLVALLYYATRGDALGGVLAALTLAMSIIPEEFPVVLTVFLALGAWRIAKQRVLTRRLPAIETLGAATVLCCDKTGTLTENRMQVVEAWAGGEWRKVEPADPAVAAIVGTAALACEADPFDPMERAIIAASERPSHAARGTYYRDTLERRYPFAPPFLAVVHGWRHASGPAHLAMKGAPETVLAACEFSAQEKSAAIAAAHAGAARGLRVLAVAQARHEGDGWHDDPRAYRWEFLGLVALADPLRRSVPAAIALCRRAGIRVIMITGDHPATAHEIARQAGIDAGGVLTGADLDSMDEGTLAESAKRVQVFARVRPEQKLRLVKALRASGEVVAMTGDGVNDAPALKAAHIGIAMGQRGTDVAREAAGLVLLDDDFASIVHAVRLGRRIYDNIRNAMRYLVAVHVPLAGVGLIPVAAGWPLLLLPVHVVFLEFVIDPACSIAFEAERADRGIMERAPRAADAALFTRETVGAAVLLGLGALAAVTFVYEWALSSGRSADAARALAFVTLVSGNLALIFANRSHGFAFRDFIDRRNAPLWLILAFTTGALAAALFAPPIAALFRFAPPAVPELLAATAAGFAAVLWYPAYRQASAPASSGKRPSPTLLHR